MRDNRDYSSTVGYQFTPMPKQLTHLLDVNLRSMLFALVDASNYFADEDGWFYRSNADLQTDTVMSQNLVKATVDTLYIYSILEVTCVGKGKKRVPNAYRLNTNLFRFFERLDMNTDIHRPENKIQTVGYKGSGYHPSYLDDEPERFLPELVKGKIIWNPVNPTNASTTGDTTVPTTETTKELTTDVTKSDNNIDNIDSIYNKEYINNREDIEYKENVNNIEYNNSILNNNILEEKLDYGKETDLLEKEFEEGMTEPMTRDEEEGREDPNEYQFIYKNLSGNNQDSITGEVQEEGSGEDSSSQSLFIEEDSERQEDSNTSIDGDTNTGKLEPTREEEFRGWKRLVDPELNKLKGVTTRSDFNERVKLFYQFYDKTVYDEGFYYEEVRKRVESYIEEVITRWEGWQK